MVNLAPNLPQKAPPVSSAPHAIVPKQQYDGNDHEDRVELGWEECRPTGAEPGARTEGLVAWIFRLGRQGLGGRARIARSRGGARQVCKEGIFGFCSASRL